MAEKEIDKTKGLPQPPPEIVVAVPKIPFDWTLESFPFKKQPAVNKKQIMELAELSFIATPHNVVFVGAPGTGKTGLAIGLLRKALIAGYRGRFYNAQDLLARADDS